MSRPSPRLSVVTITYNDAAGLRATLDSLQPLWQAWPPAEWEHVVVDGSPDVDRPLLSDLPEGWPLLSLERPPRGVAHAFNHALTAARGRYIWFLNGGDRLRRLDALARAVAILEDEVGLDLVCGGAYLTRHGAPLYPTAPRRRFVANILGRSWMYHQAVIYRRTSLARIGAFSTSYRATADYDYHIRCYVAGLRGRFIRDVLVDYDMTGGSNDVATVFDELKRIQRSHRRELPAWVNGVNEVVRSIEYRRIQLLRTVSATPLGTGLRSVWTTLNRRVRASLARRP
ncbi:MAG TPA: glycosyltransferase [Methylomirabilota bacterium]|nr:glycosyltransferase [Methylomirabilota bacterium]